ncbi:hypothetical protein [Marispirochaeta sp.]|uniref:hypothetical protein n=1 Tax=Marispirochaeta sp. TaxID=2038653 RepID=UPI0029C63EE4|nr:hypothetical protein [Marispirochaeta sp.]
MKPFCIVTASDTRYGDFLINHWYKSLTENSDLSLIDVAVLDYGLSTAQRFYLESHGVRVRQYPKDGHVVIIRFRDLADFLSEEKYEQIILSDGGDIIFQDDISPVFTEHPDMFRGVQEDLKSAFSVFLTDEFFNKEDKKRIRDVLIEEEMINAGFIAGPSEKMLRLGQAVDTMVLSKKKFGPDQLVVNYLFRTEGFYPLPKRFNYVIATAEGELKIRDGKFYADGELMTVVHNTGNISFFRPIENFGYGPERNQLKPELLRALKALHSTSDTVYETKAELRKRVKVLKEEIRKRQQRSQEELEENWSDFKELFFHGEE